MCRKLGEMGDADTGRSAILEQLVETLHLTFLRHVDFVVVCLLLFPFLQGFFEEPLDEVELPPSLPPPGAAQANFAASADDLLDEGSRCLQLPCVGAIGMVNGHAEV